MKKTEKNKTQNILFLTSTIDVGGAEKSLILLLTRLPRDKFTVFVTCSGYGKFYQDIKNAGFNCTIINVMAKNFLKRYLINLLAIIKIYILIKKNKINLVHSNRPPIARLGVLVAKISGIKSIWHCRDRYHESKGSWLMKFADAVIVVSNGIKSTYPEYIKPKLTVVYNGVDSDAFDPSIIISDKVRSEFSFEDNILIGIVGRLNPWKGQDIFINAAVVIKEKFQNAKFLIIGDVLSHESQVNLGYKYKLEKLVSDQGLGKDVIFMGSRDNIPEILKDLDILVHASKEPEPFGRVILEGMAMECAIIGTDGGGTPEQIENYSTGIIIKRNNLDSLVNAVLYLLENKNQKIKMQKASRIKVVKEFSINRHVTEMENIISALIGNNK